VQLQLEGESVFAEVRYFVHLHCNSTPDLTLAMVSLYSAPDPTLYRKSYGALRVCHHQGDDGLRVVNVKSIASVVAMVPFGSADENQYFVAENLGLDVPHMGGLDEDLTDE
jgi:hypothetical protein